MGFPIKYWAKKGFLGADELKIGYKDVLVKCDYPNPFPSIESEIEKMRKWGKPSDPLDKYINPIPLPKWMEKRILHFTVPIISSNVDLKVKDAISIAKPYLEKWGNKINAPQIITPEGVFSYEKLLEKYRIGIPIYTKDCFYLYFPKGEISNKEGEVEITKRFSEDFIEEFSVGFSFNPTDPKISFSGAKVYYTGAPNAKIVGGSFYALGYYNDWVGYRIKTHD